MYDTTRHLIEDLGGFRHVAVRLDVGATTLHSHMTAGVFPAKFYVALCELATELKKPLPHKDLFSFASLKKVTPSKVEDAA
jgi:hypothetical protein